MRYIILKFMVTIISKVEKKIGVYIPKDKANAQEGQV